MNWTISMLITTVLIGLGSVGSAQTSSPEPTFKAGDSVYVCNPVSNFTNMRSNPTARGSTIYGQLPNGLSVRIENVRTNDAGYSYYYIKLSDSPDGRVRDGYVYHEGVRASCDLPAAVSSGIELLAQRIAADNPGIEANHISDVNANYDGTTLYLVGMPDLKDLSALTGQADLGFIDLTSSGVSNLYPLAELDALTALSFYMTPVYDLSALARLPQLRSLTLFGTKVTNLDALSGLASLRELYLSQSDVRDISGLTELTSLQYLSLSLTDVSDFSPLEGLTGLKYLALSSTGFANTATLSELVSLQQLDLSRSDVMSINGISNLTNLIDLILFDTQVRDITPLANMAKLERINLGYSSVDDLSPLANLASLTSLDLRDLPVSDFSPIQPMIDAGLRVTYP